MCGEKMDGEKEGFYTGPTAVRGEGSYIRGDELQRSLWWSKERNQEAKESPGHCSALVLVQQKVCSQAIAEPWDKCWRSY